jgi:amino-acid N-acetyltransferase
MTGRPVKPTESSPEIRRCEANERAQVVSLLAACGLPEAGLSDHWETTWVAASPNGDGTVVGSVALEVHGDAALLRSLATRPEARSKGVGGSLVDVAVSHATSLGLQSVSLLTTTAEPFFARRGFASVPRRDLPPSLTASAEFRGACPASATAMLRRLR